MPILLVRFPDSHERKFALSGGRITVGRRGDNAIQINHPTVSGHHAELLAVNGHYVIRDLDSTNRSFMNGAPISEAALVRPCKVVLGTVECEYLPDDAESVPEELETLRREVGLLRRQKDDLAEKLAEQQGRIDILGHARLFTPAAGADLANLRGLVKSLTAARERFAVENRALRNEIEHLCEIVATSNDSKALKETVALRLSGRLGPLNAAVSVAPDGTMALPAPILGLARAVTPAGHQEFAELNGTFGKLAAQLSREPLDRDAARELFRVASRMAEAGKFLGVRLVAGIAGDLRPLLEEASHEGGAIDPGVIETLAGTSALLAELLSSGILPRLAFLPSPKIIAVDDDQDLLCSIIATLELADLQTIGCADAREALATMQETRCDLIFLDIGLPDLSGLEMCPCIRAIPKHDLTPIVFLSGQDTAENRSLGMFRGGSDFIGKPFRMSELTLKARTWVLKSQLAAA